jgi:signal transduction histidine kinase/CheY-like chemotaxis protein/HAMP domain-containing protein
MAANLTNQVRNIAEVTTAVAKGDLSKKITVDVRGEILELKNTVNTMVDQLNSFASEVTRVAREVGTEGRLGGQAVVKGVGGTWKDLTDSVNFMANNLTHQVRNIAEVTTAVARGDLSKKITVDARGEILELKNTVNIMVDQLNSFASEVTRVAREVGTEGRLGGQADVKGVGGTWRDLTESVNFMASNLTNQVRNIAAVTTAVANGDLSKKITVDARGEILELKNTVNIMVDQLNSFASEVTRVAREVGTEGKLGGQANVRGVAGTWKDLTESVNRMAAALTSQVRAITDVATSVTKGDLSRSITVDAAGELAALKDNINEMIQNLRETTRRSTEQDWLKTNLARFTRLLQGQRDLLAVSRLILSELAPLANIHHGTFYLNESADGEPDLRLLASYAFNTRKHMLTRIRAGEGVVGQAALEHQRILLTEVPPTYIEVNSSLGAAPPLNVIVLPVLFEGQVKAVLELASFQRFSDIHITFFDQLSEIIGIMLKTITATVRTEELLKESQSLAAELQSRQAELTQTNAQLQQQAHTLQQSEERLKSQQEELQQTNEELEEKAHLLFQQNKEVERKNVEIEKARASLEEKAGQLSLTSKYKSEFLANMSHELRTPLNSMLILSRLLSDNEDGNLTPKQVEYSQTIHTSGEDLLQLINEILDLAKIESGRMNVESNHVLIGDLRDFVIKSFEPLANSKGLQFTVDIRKSAPPTLFTDQQRLQQVLKNLLSNAFKFTDEGSVTLRVETVSAGWSMGHRALDDAEQVVAFAVTDTGIGIPREQQHIIFEAFQQADGTITRRYGGTGLGLSISREIADLLGGELRVESEAGKGSTFTLYLPSTRDVRAAPAAPKAPSVFLEQDRNSAGAGFTASAIADDRDRLEDSHYVLLIIDPEPIRAQRLLAIAHERGFKAVVESRLETALRIGNEIKPDVICLAPDGEGWVALERIKRDLSIRHIPVLALTLAKDRRRALSLGAYACVEPTESGEILSKVLENIRHFLERKVKNLLVVEDDANQRKAILALVGNQDVEVSTAETGDEALALLRLMHFDCMVIDLGLPDVSGLEVLEKLKEEDRLVDLRVIVYTAKQVSHHEELALRRLSETIIIKDARSPERLLAELSLFLHRSSEAFSPASRQMLEQEQKTDPILKGKKLLVIDDDVRNIFSLTSVLERRAMQVRFAETGQEGLELLKNTTDVDAILVDVMMPGMDGYETMREIRKMPQYKRTPMIALTAKAMKGDRDKCIEAGASDYISKPANVDRLLSILRVYLGS